VTSGDAPQSWTCVDCSMIASYSPPHSGPAPEGWENGARGWLCLNCRRNAVVAAIPSTRDAEGRAARRQALIEFELLRTPDASDGQIAGRAHTSAAVVGPVRADLLADGRLG
jgi:hypothetical protein